MTHCSHADTSNMWFVHDYYTCALCVYTNAVCLVMHMSVSCPCVCRKCAGLYAAALHGPCPASHWWDHLWRPLWGQETPTHQHIHQPENDITNASLFLVLSHYSLILFFFFGVCICFIALQLFTCPSFVAITLAVILHLFSALFTSPSLLPPYRSAPDWLHLPPQGGPTAVVTKEA